MAADSPMRSEIYGAAVVAPAGEVVRVLRAARKTVAGGYSPFFCREEGPAVPLSQLAPECLAHSWDQATKTLRAHSAGPICSPWAEGVRFFDLTGALQVAGPGWSDAQQVAEDLIRRLLDPDHRSLHTLGELHTLSNLLVQLDRAILRAHAVAR